MRTTPTACRMARQPEPRNDRHGRHEPLHAAPRPLGPTAAPGSMTTSTRTSRCAQPIQRDDWRWYTATGWPCYPTAPGAEFGSLDRDFTLADFEKDPAYQTRLDEGYKGIERTAASRGGLDSGATGKALFVSAPTMRRTRSTARARASAKPDQPLQPLGRSLANGGQQTSLALADLGSRTATNIGDLTVGGMTSAAAARAGGTAALSQGIGGAANSFMNWYWT
jgi:hypothetical protein